MASYTRDCKRCGRKIVMADRGTHYVALEPDYSGKHVHRYPTVALPIQNSALWSVQDLRKPLTYPVPCFKCGMSVFFHTNGYGDCVLFDEPLGPPWDKHKCWVEYPHERHDQTVRVSATLHDQGIVPTSEGRIFLPPSGVEMAPPPKAERCTVEISGYVAMNHSRCSDGAAYLFSPTQASRPIWTKLVVATADEKLYPFVIPRAVADGIENYAMVSVRGQWMNWDGQWLLITTEITSYPSPSLHPVKVKTAQLPKALKCIFCKRMVGRKRRWGFDEHGRIECVECVEFRGPLSAIQFLRRCRHIGRSK